MIIIYLCVCVCVIVTGRVCVIVTGHGSKHLNQWQHDAISPAAVTFIRHFEPYFPVIFHESAALMQFSSELVCFYFRLRLLLQFSWHWVNLIAPVWEFMQIRWCSAILKLTLDQNAFIAAAVQFSVPSVGTNTNTQDAPKSSLLLQFASTSD